LLANAASLRVASLKVWSRGSETELRPALAIPPVEIKLTKNFVKLNPL